MNLERKVVITQPTYLPWLGYFNLMADADVFIFLDNVQFNKRSWQQRNKIKGPDGPLWLTVPVVTKNRFEQHINEVEIVDQKWQRKHLHTIQNLYAKAPFYSEVEDLFAKTYAKEWFKLADLNISFIISLAQLLDINTEFCRASQLQGQGKKVDLLIDLCTEVKATHYLSGKIAKNYIDENNIFSDYGITLEYQSFTHPVYPQLYGEFISHLSVIDTIMNVGKSKTREFITKVKGE